MAVFILCPEESSSALVNGGNHTLREKDGSHHIGREGREHRIDESEPSIKRQKVTAPTGKTFVNPSDERLEVRET